MKYLKNTLYRLATLLLGAQTIYSSPYNTPVLDQTLSEKINSISCDDDLLMLFYTQEYKSIDQMMPCIAALVESKKSYLFSVLKIAPSLLYTILNASEQEEIPAHSSTPIRNELFRTLVQDFTHICKKHRDLLQLIVFENTDENYETITLILKNKGMLDLIVQEYIEKKCTNSTIEKLIAQELSHKKHSEYLCALAENAHCKPLIDCVSQQKDIKKRFKTLKNDPCIVSSFHLNLLEKEHTARLKNSKSFELIIRALEKEKSLGTEEYFYFYHAQNTDFAVLADFSNTCFYALLHKNIPQDFLFLQFRAHDFSEIKKIIAQKTSFSNMVSMIQDENNLLLQGASEEITRKPWQLALNLFIAGNMHQPGACTWAYLEKNHSLNDLTSEIIEEFFSHFMIPDSISKKYIPRLVELQKTAKKIYSTGRLILIAVPKKIAASSTYIAGHNLDTGRYDFKETPHFGDRTITSVAELVDFITHEQSLKEHYPIIDELEYVLSLTPITGLNPYTGIKVFTFDDTPQITGAADLLAREIKKIVDDMLVDLHNEALLLPCQKIAQTFIAFLAACV